MRGCHGHLSHQISISYALHTALSHLDKRNTYVRMLFFDYISAFNTIVPSKLITKLSTLGLNTSIWTS
jgi:gmma-aminobutyric acid receptor subunit gamma/cGMP-dependent protein kinase 2